MGVLLDFMPHPIRQFGSCRGKTTGKTQKKQHRNQRINDSSIKTEKEDVPIMTHPLRVRAKNQEHSLQDVSLGDNRVDLPPRSSLKISPNIP